MAEPGPGSAVATRGRAVAVNDPGHGVTAAKAAGLRWVAIPGLQSDVTRFRAADLVLASAAEADLAEVPRLLGSKP